MKHKVYYRLTFGILYILSTVFMVTATSPQVSAYQCVAPQSTKDNYGSNYVGMKYRSDGCYVQVKRPTKAESTDSTGVVTCKQGDQISADKKSCTTVVDERTEIVPVNDDGSPVAADAWKCEEDDEYGKDGRHTCYDSGCGLQFQIPPVACGKYYNPEENKPDPTADKAKQCTSQGGTMNMQSHQCEWKSPEDCQKRPQGTWVDGQCRAYSDFSKDEQTCNGVGGDFIPDPNGAKDANGNPVYTCVQKGTKGNPAAKPPTPAPPVDTGSAGKCGKAKTVLIPANDIPGCEEEGASAIGGIMKFAILILTVGIGITATAGIVYGAILYTSARDNAGQVNQAVTIIRDVLIGLLLYVFMISILNWLVPGGIIG